MSNQLTLDTLDLPIHELLERRLEELTKIPSQDITAYFNKVINILSIILCETPRGPYNDIWSAAYKNEIFKYGLEVFQLVGDRLLDLSGEPRPTNISNVQYEANTIAAQSDIPLSEWRAGRRRTYRENLDKLFEQSVETDSHLCRLTFAGSVLKDTARDLLEMTEIDSDERWMDLKDLAWRKESFTHAVYAVKGLGQSLSHCFQGRGVYLWDQIIAGDEVALSRLSALVTVAITPRHVGFHGVETGA